MIGTKSARRLRAAALAAIALSAALAHPLRAGERQIRLLNDLTPNRFATYRIERTVRRTVQRGSFVETCTHARRTDHIRFHLEEPQPGHVKVAQMTIDHPARVLALLHGEKRIVPAPEPEELEIAAGSARLYTEAQTARQAPLLVPAVGGAEQVMLAALLDFSHWPEGRRQKQDAWERTIALSGFRGVQRFELADIFRKEGQTLLTITMQVEGSFAGSVGELGYAFDSGAAILTWSSTRRELVLFQGQAAYRRKGADAEQYDVKVDLALTKSELLDEERAGQLRQQLVEFTALLDARDRKPPREALADCDAFLGRWRDSPWSPAVDQLIDQIHRKIRTPPPLSEAELKDLLAKELIRWQAATSSSNEAERMKSAGVYRTLAERYRPRLIELLQRGEPSVRATAAFALGFGTSPANLATLQAAARDSDATVRAWATYALAVRKSAETDAALLKALLSDREANVRARACQAVAACVAATSAEAESFRIVLIERVLRDRSDAVRSRAAAALAQIGTRADIPALRRAKKREVEPAMRQIVQSAIDVIERRSKAATGGS
ncbi:MAG: HEAT repeat domain-containing protein [Phycisphaerae bacterium]|nr:HEAT repeat domain-containing protein [Phycisphaerae bacterium]